MSIKIGMPAGMPVTPIMQNDRLRRKGILTFLALAFLPCWIAWFILHAIGFSLSNPWVQLSTAFMPAIAAVGVRKWITREGFKDSGLKLRIRQSWRYYVAAITLPLAMLASVTLVALSTGYIENFGQLFNSDSMRFLALAPLIVIVAAPIYWGEEFGWTSYLRVRLMPDKPVLSTVITGVIWGIWHWPLVFTGYFDSFGMSKLIDGLIQMALWVVLCVLLEIILSWSYWKSGSIWTTSILHAGNNLIVSMGLGHIATQNPALSLTMSTVILCAGILPVAIVLLILQRRASGSKTLHQ